MRTSVPLAFSAVVLTLTACGARGPLAFEVVEVVASPDAGAGTLPPGQVNDGGTNPGASSSSSGGSSGGSSSGGLPNIPGVTDDGGLITCGTCVATQCGTTIATCLADTTCSSALTCIATTCLAGGGAGGSSGGGLSCFTNCAGGIAGLANLLPIVECLTDTCGSACSGELGGLSGLGLP